MHSFEVKTGSKKPKTHCAVIIRQADKNLISRIWFSLKNKHVSRNSKFRLIHKKNEEIYDK